MIKTVLSAACASALLAGAALAQSASPPYRADQPIVQTDENTRIPSEMNPSGNNALPPPNYEPPTLSGGSAGASDAVPAGRRIGDRGQIPSKDNPSGTNNLPPANASGAATGTSSGAYRLGQQGMAAGGSTLFPECRGLSGEEATRCLNRESARSIENGNDAAGMTGRQNARDPLATQGRNRDR